MSKYIAIIDLPDDGKCDRCVFSDEHCCRETGHWFRRGNYDRPSDCPLIPVDGVIGRIRSMQGERKASGLDHWNDALDDALEILRIELGVTE